jgi:hypothetical protein
MSNVFTPVSTGSAFTPTTDPERKEIIRERRVAARPVASDAEPSEPRLARIARRAHELYESRGAQDGRDLDDWLQAEREIDAEIEREQEARNR